MSAYFNAAIKNDFVNVPHGFHETRERGHGRVERRRAWCTTDVQALAGRGAAGRDAKDSSWRLTSAICSSSRGRRAKIDNRDTGVTELHYDAAGNVVERITAALAARTESIRYDYHFTGLVHVDHPGVEPDITYTSGPSTAEPRQRGRITRIDDAAGSVHRRYGPLGEVVSETWGSSAS